MAKATHTPLIAQYLEIKQQYPHAMLFFQVGDFYELFFDDAVTAAQFLAITLTKRGKSNGTDIPLCGVPVHALSHYLVKLVKGGFTVAICDQQSKPQPGTVVKRAVTKVYTPGTLTDEQLLDEKSASYLCTVFTLPHNTQRGLLFTELLTGHSVATIIDARETRMLETELARFSPDEVIVAAADTQKDQALLRKWGYVVTPFCEFADQPPLSAQELLSDQVSKEWQASHLAPATQRQLTHEPALTGALELQYRYLRKNNPPALEQLTAVAVYEAGSYVQLDAATLRNLAVIRNQENSSSHTLFSVMDDAQTAMGSRLLKKWLVRPLRDINAITRRQEVVACFMQQPAVLSQLKECLRGIGDLERSVGRIALKRATHNDYLSLRTTLANIAPLKALLTAQKAVPLLEDVLASFPDVLSLIELLTKALSDESAAGSIRTGFHAELDELRDLAQHGHARIQELAVREATQHEIPSLKILYTSVAGYFIEVTKTHVAKVPEQYRQVQTLANRSRFVTAELKELEQALATAQERVDTLDKQLYEEIEAHVMTWVPELRRLANALATIDALYAFSSVAYTNNYIAPTLSSDDIVSISKGRHPVVEQVQRDAFVANDTQLGDPAWLWIITGPNMGGKSTYLRQVALISILAQCGSFVPATQASLPLVDRIFTRIGAGDNVAQGKSTFLVEMEETATICGQATQDSLVILDEVGRGTSTQDGRALAHAIIEYLAHTVKARTLFATHYHELTQLAQTTHGIANYHVACHKQGGTLHFLHTLAPGVARSSFGIDVAQLAHLPRSVIARARQLLTDPQASIAVMPARTVEHTAPPELPAVLNELAALDLDDLSPRAAFEVLARLQSQVQKSE